MALGGAPLTPEDWARVKALFLETLERPEPERRVFLERHARTEPALAEAAARLLDSALQPRAFVDPPALVRPEGMEIEPSPSGERWGEFLLQEEIGRGGMGSVHRGLQDSLGRTVAVKVMSHARFAPRRVFERFRREALAAARLAHPNIVPVLSFGEHRGVPYYAMPFIEGVSLREVLDARAEARPTRPVSVAFEPRDVRASARLLEIVLRALQYSHEQGVIHRDVKPHNILIDRAGEPHLVDFGLARCTELDGLTHSGEILGTPYYMSPEQVRSLGEPIDHRTDVFSAGAVFYELLTARLPFPGRSAQEVLFHISHSEPLSPRALVPSLPRALVTICLQALEKQPGRRYASAREFADDLSSFRANRPIRARAPTLFERGRRLARQRPGSVLAVALAGVAVFVAGLWIRTRVVSAALSQAAVRIHAPPPVLGAELTLVPLGPGPGSAGSAVELGVLESADQEFTAPPGVYRLAVRRGDELLREFHRVLEAGASVELTLPADAPRPAEGSMVLVPAGEHRLEIELGVLPDGLAARHQETVPYASFWIDRWTVTNGEYEEFLLSTGRKAPVMWRPGPSREWKELPRSDWHALPVTGVSWEDARDYAEWVGKRLPTVVEWEVAMSGGDRPWLTSENLSEVARQLNLDHEPYSRYEGDPLSSFGGYLLHVLPARSGPAWGPFGLHHPYGNVSEWVETVRRAPEDREEVSGGRWVKGGAWHMSTAWFSEGAHSPSLLARATDRSADIGFRCARSAGR